MKRGSALKMTSCAARVGDKWLMRRWVRRRSRGLDRLFVAISRTADHSMLWLILASALARAGGRGKRAAGRGILAIGIASATVNGPLKLSVRRARPVRRRPSLVRQPKSSSFPSGHSASAFAFATAATRELPLVGPVLFPLAGAVAYSRVYLGVHYPSDVVLGSVLGAAGGFVAGPLAGRLGGHDDQTPKHETRLPTEAIVVFSPHAGHISGLGRALATMERLGIRIVEQLEIEHLDRLTELIRTAEGEPRLIVAAGGDGTVGAVADILAKTDHILGVLPLGTSNDFARSLDIPVKPERAAELFTKGKVATIDLGRLQVPGHPARHFVHAATVGLNVNFAKLATRASTREHFGRFTYAVAAVTALRERPSFECELRYEGQTERLRLTQLSVINAPTFGGTLGMRIGGSSPDDRLLDVLAVEDVPLHRIVRAAMFLIFHVKREVPGVRALHVQSLSVHTDRPLEVALDGEVVANLPGDFEVVGEALRVVTPLEFEDVDD
jgi:YegS/Rv2252/BmrU family lipid kinase